jgi:RNA polymerase sigma-70 factor (ECF subfamily)
MTESTPDAALLAESRIRPEAFGELYRRHATAVFRYLARRVGASAAEDLLSEVFVAAVGARTRVAPHPSGSALPWLYGIAGNVLRGHLRRMAARSGIRDAVAAGLPPASAVVDWAAVDARLDATARRPELRAALAALTDVEREILLLVSWEGLTPGQAALALGLRPTTARSRLLRARRHAQAALTRSPDPASEVTPECGPGAEPDSMPPSALRSSGPTDPAARPALRSSR